MFATAETERPMFKDKEVKPVAQLKKEKERRAADRKNKTVGATPMVQDGHWGRGWDIAWEDIDENNFGFRTEVLTQFGMGWNAPFWSEIAEDRFGTVRISPDFEIDLSAEASMELHFVFADLIARVVVEGYNFTPFDFLLWVDPFYPKRFCYGMEYYTKGLRVLVEAEQHIDECHLGAFGFLNDDPLDCTWRTYKPEIPIFELQATDFLDVRGDYFRFHCMQWWSAEWENWDFEKNGPVSFELPPMQPAEENTSEQNAEPSNVVVEN